MTFTTSFRLVEIYKGNMVLKDEDFIEKLLATFKVEAEEHVDAISNGLIELEKTATLEERRKIVEIIFREAHSLKGAARAVNMSGIEKICQAQESVFAALNRGEIAPSSQLFDVLHKTVDVLGNLISSLDAAPTAQDKKQIAELVKLLQNKEFLSASPVSSAADDVTGVSATPAEPESDSERDENQTPVEKAILTDIDQSGTENTALTEDGPGPLRSARATEEKNAPSKTVRISTAKLDALLLQSENLLSSKLMLRQRIIELEQLKGELNTWKKESVKIQPGVRAFRHAANGKRNNGNGATGGAAEGAATASGPDVKRLLEFLDLNNSLLKKFEAELAALTKSVEQDYLSLGGMVDQHLEDMKKVLMLPASSLLEIFPRIVRELARDQGKEVELIMSGGEIEIDRRVLEEIKDPLIHLVRNSIDHGIEKPYERGAKKKPPKGALTLSVTQKGSNEIEINVADDGGGISAAKVKSAALKSGTVTRAETDRLGEDELILLVLRSGVSTSPILTDISGRGLGLAIVQEKVEKLGGTLTIESREDVGTAFQMRLPLTLTTFRGILVRVEKHLFVFPTINVKRVLRVKREEIKIVEGQETIEFDRQFVSLSQLGDVLGVAKVSEHDDAANIRPAVILGSAGKRIALLVDEILDEREVLVKNPGKQLARLKNIAGATVLGNGRVTPVLNVTDLMTSAINITTASHAAKPAGAPGKESERKSILIAEDSITARTLLKNILESAGYNVKTTVDGVEALTELKSGVFDLVVSDVEMPRMNGFELTEKIRADKNLAEIPVVLVTSLDSREDKERGIDAGANAYIVKSSFDQSNLLEAVRRMI